MLPPVLNGEALHDLLLLLLHIRERKPGVDQRDRAGCVSALERAVLTCHHLLPIVSAIPLLEVLVACEPLWDRASLGAVTLCEVEAQQRVISGVEQVDAQHFGPGATMTIRTALEAHSPNHTYEAMDVPVLRLHLPTVPRKQRR